MGFTHITCIVAIGRFSFSFVTPILNTVAGTLWMQETPRILQGRVFASRSMIARCFVPLSYVVVGPLVDIVLPKLLQSDLGLIINVVGTQALEYRLVFLNCTPFVRQYGILFRKWGVFVCQRDNESTTERRR